MKKILLSCLLVILVSSYSFAKIDGLITIGSKNKKQIALSFDDGPGKSTLKILEILKKEDIKATFFMLGIFIKKYPDLVKEVYNQGHEIGSHTYGHYNFYKYEKENDDMEYRIKREITKNEKAISNVIDYKFNLIRYPHGYCSPLAIKIAQEKGYKVVNWTYGCDWELNLTQEQMYESYKKNIKNGYILLMHDSWDNKNVISFLPLLIKNIKEQGYEIVTVGKLLQEK